MVAGPLLQRFLDENTKVAEVKKKWASCLKNSLTSQITILGTSFLFHIFWDLTISYLHVLIIFPLEQSHFWWVQWDGSRWYGLKRIYRPCTIIRTYSSLLFVVKNVTHIYASQEVETWLTACSSARRSFPAYCLPVGIPMSRYRFHRGYSNLS